MYGLLAICGDSYCPNKIIFGIRNDLAEYFHLFKGTKICLELRIVCEPLDKLTSPGVSYWEAR
jgi:hypothetical protein